MNTLGVGYNADRRSGVWHTEDCGDIQQGSLEAFSMKEPNYIKLAISRLRSYRDLKAKIVSDRRDVEDLRREKVTRYSHDIIRMIPGVDKNTMIRLTPEELQELRINAILTEVAENQREIDIIDSVMDALQDEDYVDVIRLKYFERKSERAIAIELNCDMSTVYRNKFRLLKRISVLMYGAKALGY